MKILSFVAALMLCTSCGTDKPLLFKGAYAVTTYYTYDNWPIGNLEGKVNLTRWLINQPEDLYSIQVVNASLFENGREEEDKIVFDQNETNGTVNCPYGVSYVLTLEPGPDADSFWAYFDVKVTMSSGRNDVCNTTVLQTTSESFGVRE